MSKFDYSKKKLAIIGASYLQLPLIKEAKKLGIETHVFAWAANDVGEKEADFFYPISIVEKEQILDKCREIDIDGIVTIASDLAVITVNFIAEKMGLIGNSMESTINSTNKSVMRKCFLKNGDPSPKSILVKKYSDILEYDLSYPIIVKPTDRSGSRGITKLENSDGLNEAIELAIAASFEKMALVEEYAEGKEYSVECISFSGHHSFLQITEKYTTGAPHFIETGHVEPAQLSEQLLEKIKETVFHALSGLGIEYGASHSEIKISDSGQIAIIEIGGRMGGDFIGSTLVKLSTGFDFVKAVIDISLGNEPKVALSDKGFAAVRFVLNKEDASFLDDFIRLNSSSVVAADYQQPLGDEVTDSSNRYGYCIATFSEYGQCKRYFSLS